MKDFSLILASRGRYDKLVNFLNSILNTCSDVSKIELIIMTDSDDTETHRIISDYKSHHTSFDIVLNIQERSISINSYINQAAASAIGKYIWVLGNDVTLDTPHWDKKIIDIIENNNFCHYDIIYIYVGDDIHKDCAEGGCCFPIISRRTYNCMGFFFMPTLVNWGADHWLWCVFKEINRNRIIDAMGIVKVSHICHHNGKDLQDSINKEIQFNSRFGKVDEKITSQVIEKLNKSMEIMESIHNRKIKFN